MTCLHNLVKCLCCGKEGTPGQILASCTSEKKAAAARLNGAKGGRPKTVTAQSAGEDVSTFIRTAALARCRKKSK